MNRSTSGSAKKKVEKANAAVSRVEMISAA